MIATFGPSSLSSLLLLLSVQFAVIDVRYCRATIGGKLAPNGHSRGTRWARAEGAIDPGAIIWLQWDRSTAGRSHIAARQTSGRPSRVNFRSTPRLLDRHRARHCLALIGGPCGRPLPVVVALVGFRPGCREFFSALFDVVILLEAALHLVTDENLQGLLLDDRHELEAAQGAMLLAGS